MQYPKQTDNYDVDIFNANFRELAGSVISLDTEKFDKTEAQGLFKDVAFNRGNGVITFTLYAPSKPLIHCWKSLRLILILTGKRRGLL